MLIYLHSVYGCFYDTVAEHQLNNLLFPGEELHSSHWLTVFLKLYSIIVVFLISSIIVQKFVFFFVVRCSQSIHDFASWPTMPKTLSGPLAEKVCQHVSYKVAGFSQPSCCHQQPVILVHWHPIMSLPCITFQGLPIPLLTIAHSTCMTQPLPASQTSPCAPLPMSPTLGL